MFASATNKPAFQVFDSLGQFFATIAEVFIGAQAASRVYEELSRLSASELAARGLTRDDISRLTLQALTNGSAG